MKRILLSVFGLLALAGVAYSQATVTGGFWPNWPIVGGASYSCGSVNGVSNCTVPAGPTAISGNETIPANSGQAGGTQPQNVLLSLASLNALPITVIPVTTAPAAVTAGNTSGGVLYTSAATITAASITLPAAPINGQQYAISANRTITTLTVAAGGAASIGGNSNPTVLTASTTGPQGYRFYYNAADTSWYRMQ